MRLQLTTPAALVALGALAVPADAGDRVTSRVDVYRDPWITAWVPQLAVEHTGEVWSVRGGAAVDVVSGATLTLGPDVVSSATWFDDARWQGELTVDHAGDGTTLGAGFAASVESDYTTWAPSVSVSRELFDRTVVATARYGASAEAMTTASGEPVLQRSFGHALDLGWRQIVDARTSLALSASLGWLGCGDAFGCVASPYRFVPFVDAGAIAVAARERHPDTRGRVAGTLRLSRALGPAAVHAEYGAYADTWRVTGHAASLSVAGEALQDRLFLSAQGRGALQGPAAFWRDAYATDGDHPAITPYRTVDPELGGVRDLALGARAEWSFLDVGPLLRLGVSARGDRLWFRYLGDSGRPVRDAWIVGGGLDAEF